MSETSPKGGGDKRVVVELSHQSLRDALIHRDEVAVSWNSVSFSHVLGYGSALYLLENSLLHPAEVFKTRLQIDLLPQRSLLSQARTEFKVMRKEGLRSFYRAFLFNSIASVPAQIGYLSSYNIFKEKLEENNVGFLSSFIAGGLAELVGVTCFVPIDVIVNRTITQGMMEGGDAGGGVAAARTVTSVSTILPQSGLHPSPSLPQQATTAAAASRTHRFSAAPILGCWEMTKKIVHEEGARGLFRGTGAHLLTYGPASAIWWLTYEESKIGMYKAFPSTIGLEAQLLSGCLAGAVAASLTNPVEIAKTRLQTQIGDTSAGNAGKGMKRTTFNTLKLMWRAEGMRGMGKGLLPKLAFTVPVSALSSILYETIMTLSQKRET